MESRKHAEETRGKGGEGRQAAWDKAVHSTKHHCLSATNQEEAGAHQPDDPVHRFLDRHLPQCPAAPPCPDRAEEHINIVQLLQRIVDQFISGQLLTWLHWVNSCSQVQTSAERNQRSEGSVMFVWVLLSLQVSNYFWLCSFLPFCTLSLSVEQSVC